MTTIRNFIDQLFDGSAKKNLRQSCQLVRKEYDAGYSSLGSEEEFSNAHDLLIMALSKLGKATEEMEEVDFNLSRDVGDQSYIGVVCNRYSAKVILAVRSAQLQFSQPYPVCLDCDEAEVIILHDGQIFGSIHDELGDDILARFGFII